MTTYDAVAICRNLRCTVVEYAYDQSGEAPECPACEQRDRADPDPEPDTVTVTLPRDVVEAAWGLLIYASTSITIADWTREMYFKAADDLLAALDAASATQEADQ